MESPVRYQVIFSGHLRKGYTAAVVKKNLATRLKLPLEKVEHLFSAGHAVLKKTASEEEARRIVLQLAATGAIATIETVGSAPASEKATEEIRQAVATARKAARAVKPVKFHPLRHKFLLKPLLYHNATIELLFNLFHAAMILAVLGGVLVPSLTSSWVGRFIDSPLLALPVQLLIVLLAGLLLLILLKPLLSLRFNSLLGIATTADQEPDLHAFIEDVCERIGAPLPAEIRVHKDAEIRTAYHRGAQGLLRNQPVLTIGLPLIAGLNCSQLAALVAHALNRYRHKFAPRATALLLAQYGWLQRAVYEPDIVDRTLQHWHEEKRLGDGLLKALQRLAAPARRLAKWRLRLSRLLERRVLQRTVAEADKMALAFTGTEGFIRMMDQNILLADAARDLLPGLEEKYQNEGVLPDNLVHLMVLRSRQYPVNMPQKLRTAQEQQMAAIRDIMPSDNQRLKRVERQPIYGAYYCHSPAAVLFRNYSKLARLITMRYYHHRLRLPISPYHMHRIYAKNSLESVLHELLDAGFRKLYVDYMPLKLRQHMHDIPNLDAAKKQWRIGMARCDSEYERAKLAREQFDHAEATLVDAATVEEIYLAGLWREWGEEKRKISELAEVHQSTRDAESEHEQAVHTLEHYLTAHGVRLGAVLAAATLSGESTLGIAAEIHQLVSLLERIEHVHIPLRELKTQTILLETLLSYRAFTRQQKLDSRIEVRSADVKNQVTAIGVALKSAHYPFDDHPDELLMSYVLKDATSEDTPQGNADRGHDTIERLAQLERRVLLRLIEIAEQVEKAMGFRS